MQVLPKQRFHFSSQHSNCSVGNWCILGETRTGGDLDANVVDALMATSAIQGAFPVKHIGDTQYIDGGNGANLPLEYAIRHRCNHIILARDNTKPKLPEQQFTKIWDVVMRAYLAAFTNITVRDRKWAGELSKRLAVIEKNRARLTKFTEEISEESLRAKYQQMLGSLEPIFDNKIPIEVYEVVPDWSPDNIVDFRPDVSKRLIEDGYQKAQEALKEFPR